MIFGYARVSSKGQNLDRQLAELRDLFDLWQICRDGKTGLKSATTRFRPSISESAREKPRKILPK